MMFFYSKTIMDIVHLTSKVKEKSPSLLKLIILISKWCKYQKNVKY